MEFKSGLISIPFFFFLLVQSSWAASGHSARPDSSSVVITNTPLRQWEYVVSGKFTLAPDQKDKKIEIKIQVNIDVADVADGIPVEINKANGRFTVWLKGSLVKGDKVRAQLVIDDSPGVLSDAVTVQDPLLGDCPEALVDCRETIQATFFLGIAVDTFAGAETVEVLNPDATGGLQERGIGGFDFTYRLAGDPKRDLKDGRNWSLGSQLWLFGETVHGTRSADIDCQKNAEFPTCRDTLAALGKDPNPQDQLLFILRNATSLEGFAGLRWEFLTLQRRSGSPINVYLKGQAGFLTTTGTPDDVVDVHHFGLGVIATKGDFQDSYVEVGFGRTDVFAIRPKSRWKIDGLISRSMTQGISFFAQIVVDSDVGGGSDSIQSYIGFDFDLNPANWIKAK